MYFVYIIQCEDNSLYTGMTSDIQKRFKEHKSSKGARYTRSHKPVKIVYTEECETMIEALKRERQIKGWKRNKKLNLIKFGKLALEG